MQKRIFETGAVMIEEMRILEGQSRYNIFTNWQQALQKALAQIGIRASIVPVTAPYSDREERRTLTLGFNLVRYWATENRNQPHFAWMVDHPVFMGAFYLSRFSRMPMNPDRCMVGSVDFKWTQFAREIFGFPHVHFLPHATVLDSPVTPNWRERSMDIVFFGSVEQPDDHIRQLRATLEKFSIPGGPILDRIIEGFSYADGRTLDMTTWELIRKLNWHRETALIFLNAFFPGLDNFHRYRSRIQTLASIRRHEVHVFGTGPWKSLHLPDNIIIHDPVPHSEALSIMRQARILLNHTPSLSGGAHERIFDAVASGCHVLTTPSDYLSAEFPGHTGISMYGERERSNLDEMLNTILHDPAASTGIVAAQQTVFRRHSMAVRAARIRDIVQNRWPDLFSGQNVKPSIVCGVREPPRESSARKRVLALIVARGGSKTLPRKNLQPVAGHPLIAHTFLAAKQSRKLDRIIISTNDTEIAAVAQEYGIEVPFKRPDELAGDSSHVIDASLHAVQWLETHDNYRPDFVLLLQPTSPLRTAMDIDAAIELAEKEHTDAVVSVTPADQHPYLMKKIDSAGHLSTFFDTNLSRSRRQDLPSVYSLNGAIYLVRRTLLLEAKSWCPDNALGYVMPPDRSIDINDAGDLQIADLRLRMSLQKTADRTASMNIDTNRDFRLADPMPECSGKDIAIQGHVIGPGRPCFIIAEAGVNHNGSLETALRLVDAALNAGADAVKFQTFRTEKLVTRHAQKAEYQKQTTGAAESQFEMLKKLELNEEAHRQIVAYARQKNICFLSTPFDEESADFLDSLGVPAFKVGSGDLTNLPLLRHIALKRKPIILSTGMADMTDVEAAIATVRDAGNREVILLHCVSRYPTDPAEANLNAMNTLAHTFGVPAGYSDHTPGIDVAIGAVAIGACVVEKHLTLDHNLPGPDHRASLEPDAFAAMVKSIRTVQSALGNGDKQPVSGEANVAAVARKSLIASRTIKAGTMITDKDIVVKRPGTGLRPAMLPQLLGRRASVNIEEGELLRLDMFEKAIPETSGHGSVADHRMAGTAQKQTAHALKT
jgi:N-acetylneuraminate synthase